MRPWYNFFWYLGTPIAVAIAGILAFYQIEGWGWFLIVGMLLW